MTMLVHERQPEAAPPEPETPAPEASAPARTCSTCGTEMAVDQDWCLSCGTAAPGRLGNRPGMRAASTIVMVVALLTGGAVAASYAALSDDANRQVAQPAGPSGSPVAQVPPTTDPASGTPVTPVTPEGTTSVPTTPTVPSVTAPSIPNTGATAPPIKLPTTQSQTPFKITGGPTTTTNTQPSTTTNQPTTSTPSSTTKQPTTSTKAEPTAIDFPADSVALYDPYSRLADQTDPADAYDSSAKTSYSVTAKDGAKMGLGVVVDLERAKAVKELELTTDTPGFRVEIYATDSDELPPDILDTRWAHIKDRSRVDETKTAGNKAGDRKERVVLGAGTVKYRYYVLWLTTPPKAGPTVRLQDLKLLS